MNEISLLEFVAKWSRAEWEGESNFLELRHMLDARIRRAEAAERAVQALVVWMHDSTTKNWEPVMDALQEHADQGRVVRRLEEST